MKKEVDYLKQITEFHKMFSHPIELKPCIPDASRCRLRIELLSEELGELKDAIANGDLVAIADAFCDLQYVLGGAVLEFGMGKAFPSLFEEVHRSNMSKACNTIDEAENTVKFYKEHHGVDSYFTQKGNYFLVYRTSDNKTLKSINYTPANLKSIL